VRFDLSQHPLNSPPLASVNGSSLSVAGLSLRVQLPPLVRNRKIMQHWQITV